jgi:hypothetical protein
MAESDETVVSRIDELRRIQIFLSTKDGFGSNHVDNQAQISTYINDRERVLFALKDALYEVEKK